MDRYVKQARFLGRTQQESVIKGRVAIVGLGATGSIIADWLTRAGVGFLRLIDRDIVEVSNLQRQCLYDERDLDQAKATCALNKLKAINASVKIDAISIDLLSSNALELLGDVDLIIDGTDNFETRFLINDVAIRHHIPWIYTGAIGAEGICWPIKMPQTGCLRCLVEDLPEYGDIDTCDSAGVLGPAVGVIASWAAVEAIKILVNEKSADEIIRFDLWSNHRQFVQAPTSRCRFCTNGITEFLDDRWALKASPLCGTLGVQLRVNPTRDLDLAHLRGILERQDGTQWKETPRFIQGRTQTAEITLFKDGRALFRGDISPEQAKRWYVELLGA